MSNLNCSNCLINALVRWLNGRIAFNLILVYLEIMKDDRLYLRTLVKDGNGEEIEQILLKHKKKQGNLTII